jgi:hypothetical protein
MPTHSRWTEKFEIKPGCWVFVPSSETYETGRLIKSWIERRWSAPKHFFHLQKGGHVAALRSHINNEFFAHLDLKQFFNSINRSRITRALKPLVGYSQARKIAYESTVLLPNSEEKTYVLPFGFVQSPIVASICLHKSALGRKISELNRQKEIEISVYVDDIIISATEPLILQRAFEEVKAAVDRASLSLNADKEEGPAKKITAFNIELSPRALSIEEQRLQEFIKEYKNSENYNQLAGIIGYVESINKSQSSLII